MYSKKGLVSTRANCKFLCRGAKWGGGGWETETLPALSYAVMTP